MMLDEVLFILACIIVLSALIIYGYTVVSNAEKNSKRFYEYQCQVYLNLTKYFDEVEVFFPRAYNGSIITVMRK